MFQAVTGVEQYRHFCGCIFAVLQRSGSEWDPWVLGFEKQSASSWVWAVPWWCLKTQFITEDIGLVLTWS